MSNVTQRAVGYVRVSQEKQVDQWGLPAQEHALTAKAELEGWTLVGIYREEGVSGYKRARPELDRLLSDAGEGKFDVVVFPSIDRAARSVTDLLDIDGRLQGAGVDVVFLREGIDSSTYVGRFVRTLFAAIAELEGEMIHERLERGRARKAAAGGYVGGRPPYGKAVRRGKVVDDPRELRIAGDVRDLRARGLSLREIAAEMNGRGIPSRTGKTWHVSTVLRALAA